MGKQGLYQKLSIQQKLSPQQILLMKMLQIPAIALEQRIKQEIEENPALDELTGYDDNGGEAEKDEDEFINELDNSESDEFDLKDFIGDDDTPGYKLRANNYSRDDDNKKEIPFSVGKSFHDHLTSQLGLKRLNEKQLAIATTIIGNMDDAGYLRREISSMVDDLSFSQNITTTEGEILKVLKIIHELEPAGVGARDLRECLLIQLRRWQAEEPETNFDLSILILEKYFEEFSKKHYDKIIKRARVTEDELREAIEQILKLNPKPGIITNNLGVIYAYQGNFKQAETYFNEANKMGIDNNYNLGIIDISKADYKGAISKFAGVSCNYNVALANMIDGNNGAATTNLDCARKNAATYYLMAIAGARTDNQEMMLSNLKKAIKANKKFKEEAKIDREFIKYFNNAEFKDIVK
jgi:tetratricopeptide (TPR) repeat protein